MGDEGAAVRAVQDLGRAGQDPGRTAAVAMPGHLLLHRVLRRTPTATLWSARDRLAGADVVVKVLQGDGAAARVETEARALARLGRHPHVLEVRAVGIEDATSAWVVTALAGRGALDGAAPVAPGELREWLAQVAGALAHAHAVGVVHGDVTPANVLLGDTGAPDRRRTVALLGDFGSATIDGVGAIPPGGPALVGCTPAFAAPERCRGAPPSPEGDVYGLVRSAHAVLLGHAVDGLPRGVRRLLRAALHPDPSERPSAAVLHRGLR